MNFAGKWMELENIILNEVTQAHVKIHAPKKLNKKEGPSKDA